LVASILANQYRDPKKRRKPYLPEDLMPTRQNAKPTNQPLETDPEAVAAKIRRMFGHPEA